MRLFTRRKSRSRAWRVIAAALGLTLVAGGVGLPSAAHATEVIVLDDNFEYTGNGFMFLNSQGNRWAQPFTPKQEGALASITVVVNSAPAYEFQGAQVHEMNAAGEIDPDPIAGGIGELSFAPHPTVSSVMNAVVSFPQRPALTVGQYYALVVDPRAEDPATGGMLSTAFPIKFTSQAESSYFVHQESAAGWGLANYTGQVHFSVHLALPVPDVVITPSSPTLAPSTECNVPGTVTIPVQDGVEYTSTEVGTDVTVAARALPGYAFEVDAQTSWTFSVAAEQCPVALIEVTPVSPTVTPATCEAPGAIATPQVDGLAYTVTGPLAQTTVTASALPGYTLAAGAQTTWTYDLTALSCKEAPPKKPVTQTLAATGATSNHVPLLALASVVLGAAALLVRGLGRSRRG